MSAAYGLDGLRQLDLALVYLIAHFRQGFGNVRSSNRTEQTPGFASLCRDLDHLAGQFFFDLLSPLFLRLLTLGLKLELMIQAVQVSLIRRLGQMFFEQEIAGIAVRYLFDLVFAS